MHEANNPIIITVSNNIKNIEERSSGIRTKNSTSFMNDYAYLTRISMYLFLCCISDERMNGK